MKKLRNKVFFVIFTLLTIFTALIFITNTVRTYIEKKDTITDILTKVPKMVPTFDKREEFSPNFSSPQTDERRIYLDFTIYTIFLDKNGQSQKIINYTFSDEIEEKKINEIADEIIKNHESDMYIGNLFTSKYAYFFTNNTLTIMDNTVLSASLVQELLTNVVLFLLCEVAIFVFTYLITKWIILPVSKSFEKQKNFIADASHELKTPLSVMIASADAFFNDKDEKWVKNMKSESERMAKLVTELLNLAKTEQDHDIVMSENNLFGKVLYPGSAD